MNIALKHPTPQPVNADHAHNMSDADIILLPLEGWDDPVEPMSLEAWRNQLPMELPPNHQFKLWARSEEEKQNFMRMGWDESRIDVAPL